MATTSIPEVKAPDFIHVNLLPIEYRVVKKDYSFLIDMRILISTLALIGVGAAYLIGQSFFHANLQNKQTALADVQKEIGANAYVGARIKELEKLRDEKTAKNNSLKSISVSKKKWVRILEGINKSMPLNMWIETMKQSDANDNELELKGRTYIFPEIAEYMIELEKNEYFSKVFLNSIELQKDQKNSSFMFTIRINMNPNAGIDHTAGDPGKSGDPGKGADAGRAPDTGKASDLAKAPDSAKQAEPPKAATETPKPAEPANKEGT